jgi:hypothetical protein
MQHSEFFELITKHARYYNAELKDEQYDFLWQDLKKYSTDEIDPAFEILRKDGSVKFFPRNGEILAALKLVPKKENSSNKKKLTPPCAECRGAKGEAFCNYKYPMSDRNEYYLCEYCLVDVMKKQESERND